MAGPFSTFGVRRVAQRRDARTGTSVRSGLCRSAAPEHSRIARKPRGKDAHDIHHSRQLFRRQNDQRGKEGHLRLIARHRVRVVRLLPLRHARARSSPRSSSPASTPTAGFIFALLAFAAGFAVRPFGALVFGRIGDMVGRKYTFLVTMTHDGRRRPSSIGVLPGYASMGHRGADHADRACACCRAWRSAANTAARRPTSPSTRRTASAASTPAGSRPPRRSACSWRCCVILGIRTAMGEEAFGDWGWRIPFLLSVVLLGGVDLDPAAAQRNRRCSRR